MQAEQKVPGSHAVTPPAVDVFSLLEGLMPPVLQGEVAVRGIVRSLSYYPDRKAPTRVYGELTGSGQGSCISFSCPAGQAPELIGEPVVLEGKLRITTPAQHPGFKVQLVGHRLGSWLPPRAASLESLVLSPERRRLSLAQLLQSDSPKCPLLLGTATAIADAMHQLGSGASPMPATKVVSTELGRLQAEIVAAARAYSALCLLRGGGDPMLFAAFNDPDLIKALLRANVPFYVAVGHVTDLTLADKYADQSFPTPTAFGSAYLRACQVREEREDLQRRLTKAEAGLQEFKAQRNQLYKSAQQETLNENIRLVAQAAQSLGGLPDAVSRNATSAVTASVDTAVQRFLAALPQPSRRTSWPSILCVFLLGCLLGGMACYRILAKRNEQTLSAPQIAAPTADLPPAVKARTRRH